jgi:hypothetical protein
MSGCTRSSAGASTFKTLTCWRKRSLANSTLSTAAVTSTAPPSCISEASNGWTANRRLASISSATPWRYAKTGPTSAAKVSHAPRNSPRRTTSATRAGGRSAITSATTSSASARGYDLGSFGAIDQKLREAMQAIVHAHPLHPHPAPTTLREWAKHVALAIQGYGAYFAASIHRSNSTSGAALTSSGLLGPTRESNT